MKGLKKCPFCGGQANVYKGFQDFLIYKQKCYSVFCESCKCTTQYESTEKEALERWNNRV